MRVTGVNRFDRREHGFERVVGLHRADREGDILGCDRLAVMEGGVFDQIQGHRQAIIRDSPTFRQIGLRVPVFVIAQGRREQLGARLAGGDPRLHRRVEVARSALNRPHQGAALFRAVGDGDGGHQSGREEAGGDRKTEPCEIERLHVCSPYRWRC